MKPAVVLGLVLLLAAGVALWIAASTPGTPEPSRPRDAPAPAAGERARVAPRPQVPAAAESPAPAATLRGVVVDEDTGEPVSGARVGVVARDPDADVSGLEAVSDAAGRYALAAPPGRVLVRAACDGWFQPGFPHDDTEVELWRRGAAYHDRRAVDVPASGEVIADVVLARTCVVEGRVLLPDGSPAPDADVVVEGKAAGARSTRGRSGADGRFRITGVPATPNLWAEATLPGLVTEEPVALSVEHGGTTTGVEIRLRRPPVVRGRLTSAGGRSLDGAGVQVLVVSGSRLMQWGPAGEWVAWDGAPRTPAGAGGVFEVPVWPLRGDFVVRATCPGHQPVTSEKVVYDASREVYEVDLRLPAGAALTGRVTAADTGAGIAGAVVRAAPATNGLAMVVAPLRAVCGADGRFRFDGLTEETYTLAAEADGRVEQRLPPVTVPASDVVFALSPALSISGTVRLGGEALAGAIVGVQSQEDDGLELFDWRVDPFSEKAVTGTDGAFTVGGLAAGRYCLHVRPSAGGAFRATFSAPVTAGAADVVVDVVAAAAGDAPDPDAGMSNHDLGCAAAGLNLARDYERSVARWESLLARPLTRNERAAALLEYASPLGNLGRHDEQEAALREALDLAGPDSVRGLEALSRIAWRKYWAGDAAEALEVIGPVTRSPDASQAAGARWSAATFAAASGDVAGALESLRALRAELLATRDSLVRRLLPQVERSLASLEER